MTWSKSIRKTLRWYRNKWNTAWAAPQEAATANKQRDDLPYRRARRTSSTDDGPHAPLATRRRRVKRRHTTRIPPLLWLCGAAILLAVGLAAAHVLNPQLHLHKLFAARLARRLAARHALELPIISPHSSGAVAPVAPVPTIRNDSAVDGGDAQGTAQRAAAAAAAAVADAGISGQQASNPTTIAATVGGATAPAQGQDTAQALTPNQAQIPTQMMRAGGTAMQGSQQKTREQDKDHNTRTCYTNPISQNAVCVHVPLCMRHSAMVYISDTLRCGAYTNAQGRAVTMSQSRCVELQRYVEALADMYPIQHKGGKWLGELHARQNILWFEGDTLLLRLHPRCTSVQHFASRVLMLHHMLQHAHRYGLSDISNVVIAAHEAVAKKIRYSKSWHHGLLSAIVYPNSLVYSHAAAEQLVAGGRVEGQMLVFVTDGLWKLAKGRRVPCFRRVGIAAPGSSRMLLTGADYPGTVQTGRAQFEDEYSDADTFRHQVFTSLGFVKPPEMHRRILYLHRATTRALTADGLHMLEQQLRATSERHKMRYDRLDMSGLSFAQQVRAVGGASIAVGIHGTQMLTTLFLPKHAAIVEMFPFGFRKDLFVNGSGAGLHYGSHQVVGGQDFIGLSRFGGNVGECQRLSSDCRRWYQSDDRTIQFGQLDAAAMGHLLERAVEQVSLNM